MGLLLACCLVITAIVGAAHAQVNCLLNTPSGIIDLSQIPHKSLVMTQRFQGTLTDKILKFNLCIASSEPPQGANNCDIESYVGEWGSDGGCVAQFDAVSGQPTYNNSVVTIGYYNQNAWTATVILRCGTTPLQSDGIVDVSPQLQFTIPLTSQYACPQQPNCKVGPFDLSPVPSKAFPVKVVDANGSSTLHVVQLSLCAASDQPPRGADSCGVAAYYGEWSSMGACEAQFDAVARPSVFNGTHAILYFLNNKSASSQLSTVYLGCGTTDLDVIGVRRDSRGDLFTTATSRYACAATCSLLTPRGIVDLSPIPETVLPIKGMVDGRIVTLMYRFSLCQLSIVPPSGSEFCGKSYVGRWPTTGVCDPTWQYDKASPLSYANGVISIAYASTQHDFTLTVLIECGNATLAVAGDATNEGYHTDVPLSSKYACPR